MNIYVVGLGPGAPEQMTRQAEDVLGKCEVIAGYDVYVDLIRNNYPDKQYVTTPMRKETERCRAALEHAASGRETAMVCSGDAGIYGLAGLILELAPAYPGVSVEVIPGVTAASSGGALLGAPLGHDFVTISLSDLLTPWEVIEKRLKCAAEGDFAICLYNPSSVKRHDYLKKACDLLLKYRDGGTVCGITRNIGRDGESMRILSLTQLGQTPVDMFTTVFIGNSKTTEIGGRMVTPRGYLDV